MNVVTEGRVPHPSSSLSLSPTLYFVIPVLNEAANVSRVLSQIGEQAPRLGALADCREVTILLIDDGSTDGTADLARHHSGALDLEVLSHESNRGPGAAFATAFTALAERITDQDRVVTMEGDNTSPLSTAERMIVRQKEGYEMVLASPYAYGGRIQPRSVGRAILSEIASAGVKAMGLHGFHTTSSFFRLYTGELIARLQATFGASIVELTGFECMVELLIKAVLLKARISEVEVLLDMSNRAGKRKMRIVRTTYGYLKLLRGRTRWSRMAHARLWRYVNSIQLYEHR
jgi:dolichol-phosphate mannosyltransferase